MRRAHPIRAARRAVGEARELRAESPMWTKNRSRVEAQLRAAQGLVFWNTLERNKFGRTAPLQVAFVGAYVAIALARETYSGTELGVLLLGCLTWYALEVVNTAFEYLLDELHGTHFDERHARIKDMGAGASTVLAIGLIVAAGVFCV